MQTPTVSHRSASLARARTTGPSARTYTAPVSEKPSKPISLDKGASGNADKPSAKPSPPRFVQLAAGALVLSGLGAVGASASLYGGSGQITAPGRPKGDLHADGSGVKGWIVRNLVKDNNKKSAKDHKTAHDLLDQVTQQQKGALISSIVLLAALGFAAFAAWRGRYYSRWVIIGLWVLASFTGTLAGFTFVLNIGSDAPVIFKFPAFIAALSLIVAVVLTNLRPSTEYFNLSRPEPRPGQPVRRGLFAPRPPRAAAGAAARKPATVRRDAATRPVRGGAATAARSKQRTSADAVAKGAELARSRAKASKSRRTGD